MSITRTPIVDDDGTLTLGTIWNNAWKQEFYNQIDAALAADAATLPGSTAPTTTGTVTAEPIPSGTGVLATYHNNASLKTIQGMAAGINGQLWVHYSKGAGQVDFAHLHASGTALGKCKNFATSGNTPLAAGYGVAIYQYDATVTQWRLVAHEQGAWITPAYADANFTTNVADNWGVDSGDVTNFRWILRGRTLTVAFTLSATSVTGTPSELRISNAAFGGFTGASVVYNPAALGFQGVTTYPTQLLMNATTFLAVKKTDSSNWAADTNSTYMYGEITFDVT